MKQKSRIGKRRHFSGHDISITHAISKTLFQRGYAMRIASSRALNGALPRSIRFNMFLNRGDFFELRCKQRAWPGSRNFSL